MTVPDIRLVPLASGGSGLPFLVGPSLGTRVAACWGPTVPLLADRHPVFGWDLPGHGVSPAAREPFTMDELAEGVERAADAVGLGRFAAAGVSLGGVASLALALRSTRVTAVTLVCSLPRIGTAAGWADRAAAVRASGTPSLVAGSSARWFGPGFIEKEPTVTSGMLRDLMDVDDESYALCVEALGATDLTSRVSALSIPFTIIAGAEDGVIPLADAEAAVGEARVGRLEVLPGVAHQAAVEDPASVARILLSEVPA